MNRAQLKHRARQSMSWAKPGPMVFTLVYMLIPLLLGGFTSGSSVYNTLNGYAATESIQISIIGIVVTLLYSVVQAGYTKYCLNIAQGQPTSWGTLFEFINRPFRFIGLSLLMILVVMGCSLLGGLAGALIAFIPFVGIVAVVAVLAVTVYVSMGFTMAYYVAVDEPHLGLTACMKASWHLMAGRRWEFFVLVLSFILWSFACIVVIPMFWVTPYMSITLANYYCLISGQLPTENRPPQASRPWAGFEEYPPPESDDFEPR